jgi:hypothetical protein
MKKAGAGHPSAVGFPSLPCRGLAQTLFFNVCDLPKARFAER